jgi:muconate cycloisomerase
MQIHLQPFTVNKRFPLTISRGTTSHTTNVWVRIQHDGIEGWGEASPFSVDKQPSLGKPPQTPEVIVAQLQAAIPHLQPFSPFDRQAIESICRDLNVPSAARAAIDLALHDWLGKRVGHPLWQLWGLDRSRIVPTSVTIGIGSPAAARQRMLDWLQVTPVKAVKVKLGSPAGTAADQAMLLAVKEVAPADAKLSIDANGGWSLEEAIALSHWLADQGVTYIEQPLPRRTSARFTNALPPISFAYLCR